MCVGLGMYMRLNHPQLLGWWQIRDILIYAGNTASESLLLLIPAPTSFPRTNACLWSITRAPPLFPQWQNPAEMMPSLCRLDREIWACSDTRVGLG